MDEIRVFFTDILFRDIQFANITLPFNFFDLLIKMVLPIIIVLILIKILKTAFSAILRKSNINEITKKNFLKWTNRILNILFFILIIALSANLFGAENRKYLKLFFNVLNQPFIESGSTRITIITVILTIPIFYISSWIGKNIKKLINRDFLKTIGLDESTKFSFTSIVQYGVMIIVILLGLSIIGIDLSALGLIFGVLGIGLGFGLQKMVSNIIAGISIIFSRPIKEGDRIIIDGHEGIVTHIKLNSTNITTLTNENIIVPNFNFIENIVHNFSYENKKIIIKNQVQISYSDNPEFACKILKKIPLENKHVLHNPEPVARFESFGDSGLNLCLYTWISDASYKLDVNDWINRQIWLKFREENISIPFPHVQIIASQKPQ